VSPPDPHSALIPGAPWFVAVVPTGYDRRDFASDRRASQRTESSVVRRSKSRPRSLPMRRPLPGTTFGVTPEDRPVHRHPTRCPPPDATGLVTRGKPLAAMMADARPLQTEARRGRRRSVRTCAVKRRQRTRRSESAWGNDESCPLHRVGSRRPMIARLSARCRPVCDPIGSRIGHPKVTGIGFDASRVGTRTGIWLSPSAVIVCSRGTCTVDVTVAHTAMASISLGLRDLPRFTPKAIGESDVESQPVRAARREPIGSLQWLRAGSTPLAR
jgi:hypothetical protein